MLHSPSVRVSINQHIHSHKREYMYNICLSTSNVIVFIVCPGVRDFFAFFLPPSDKKRRKLSCLVEDLLTLLSLKGINSWLTWECSDTLLVCVRSLRPFWDPLTYRRSQFSPVPKLEGGTGEFAHNSLWWREREDKHSVSGEKEMLSPRGRRRERGGGGRESLRRAHFSHVLTTLAH